MAGAGQTPYLIDPNTSAKGYESSEIVDYLEETYALWYPELCLIKR